MSWRELFGLDLAAVDNSGDLGAMFGANAAADAAKYPARNGRRSSSVVIVGLQQIAPGSLIGGLQSATEAAAGQVGALSWPSWANWRQLVVARNRCAGYVSGFVGFGRFG